MNVEVLLLVPFDILRAVVLLLGGAAVGLALSEAKLYHQRRHTPTDPWFGKRRLHYMVAIRLGIATLVGGVTVAISLRLGEEDLQARTPLALVAFALLVYGMRGILIDDETLVDENYGGPKRRSTDDPEMGSGG